MATSDDIQAMPAGREMDALVAERVMGWTFCLDAEPFCHHADRGGCITTRGPMIFRDGNRTIPYDWRPSGDIAAAMDVLCKARGSATAPFQIQSVDGTDRYACWIGGAVGFGLTISEAICRAALTAARSPK